MTAGPTGAEGRWGVILAAEGAMRTGRCLVAVVLGAATGCAGKHSDEPEKPKAPVEKVFDVRGQATAAPDGTTEKHVTSGSRSASIPTR